MDFKLPEVGENITKGLIVRIGVKQGDAVKKDQTLLELETDKATIEVPCPSDGTIAEVFVREGQEVHIGEKIFKINTTGGTPKTNAADQKSDDQPDETVNVKGETKSDTRTVSAPPNVNTPTRQYANTPPLPSAATTKRAVDVAAAPSVRRLAREVGVDITQVRGSGPRGRISKDDVKAHAKALLSRGAAGAASPAPRPLPDFSRWGQIEVQAMNNIRRKTSEHLSYCWTTIPHVTQFDKADITDLEELRKKHSTKDRKLTITPFLLKIMASALQNFPQFNASVKPDTNEIILKKYLNIGVAVDTPRGLVVPVVRDVDSKSIFELADELNATAERIRNGKISLEELQGGSMTLTNLGGIGGTAFTPIVNWPEVCILGVSRGAWEPVYDKTNFVARFRLPLSLSYDHRVIDGADGARFLRWICAAIEQPFLMELER